MLIGHIVDGSRRLHAQMEALQRYWSVEHSVRERSSVDAGAALTLALAHLTQAIEDSGASVDRSDLPTVQFHETPVVELFQNLVENAIKYRRPNVPPRVHVDALPAGSAWEFAVRDNGIGVPPEARRDIFLPFKRVKGSNVPGSGMGLAICSRIVEAAGGRLWVESDDSGSVFRFTLPGVRR
jgi:signal transduction histidine kinase